MGTIVVIAVLLALLAWFFWPSKAAPPRTENDELDQAEREVQEAANEETVRDWGPGAGQKPLP